MRRRLESWFGSFDGLLGYELQGLTVAVAGDVAFCHSLNQVKGTRKEGGALDMWWHATVCLRKIEGRWLIVHEHSSVPFDMNTGEASMGLRP